MTSPEQIIRDALDAAVEHPKYPAIAALAALDMLVARAEAAEDKARVLAHELLRAQKTIAEITGEDVA